MSIRNLLTAGAAVAALALPGGAAAATPKLFATVGPNDTISLKTASGAAVRSVKAGTYAIVVRDRADDHNFVLRGPGVSKATGVGTTGTVTWRVKFLRGKTYTFVCAPHAGEMRGSFRAR
jgi:hypothetical protein